MITVKQLYIQDVSKAPFVDRFFYYLLNYFGTDLFERECMTINPLRWSLMTALTIAYLSFIYLVLIPIIGIPCILYDTWRMPKNYESDEFEGCYVDCVRLIRPLPTQ